MYYVWRSPSLFLSLWIMIKADLAYHILYGRCNRALSKIWSKMKTLKHCIHISPRSASFSVRAISILLLFWLLKPWQDKEVSHMGKSLHSPSATGNKAAYFLWCYELFTLKMAPTICLRTCSHCPLLWLHHQAHCGKQKYSSPLKAGAGKGMRGHSAGRGGKLPLEVLPNCKVK